MRLHAIEVSHVRILKQCSLTPNHRFNLISGENGSGKTSLLEAIHMIGAGRSFIGRKFDQLITKNEKSLVVFAEAFEPVTETLARIGFRRARDASPEIKINGERQTGLARLASLLPVQAIHPASDSLLLGGPKERRQYLDWGLFHVEPHFLLVWQHFRSALDQRNAALKARSRPAVIRAWDGELIKSALALDVYRSGYIRDLLRVAQQFCSDFFSGADLAISYQRGWPESTHYEDVLAKNFDIDQKYQQTSAGPQRADLNIRLSGLDTRAEISRGQRKLLVYVLKLAQVCLLQTQLNKKSILLIDDLSSELDLNHQQKVLSALATLGNQCFLTAVNTDRIAEQLTEFQKFHVEHGCLRD